MTDRPAICATVIEAGKEIGLEYRADVNDLPPGAGDYIGWCQQTRGGRRRASAARTYLRPALKRPNLQTRHQRAGASRSVRRQARDRRRILARAGVVERVEAAREVILSAGAIGSPHILQLSGVGDPEHLAEDRRRRSCMRCAASATICRTTTSRASLVRSSAPRPLNERSRGLPLRQRGHALSVHRQRHDDLRPVACRRFGQGAGGVGDARHAMHLRAREL